MYALMAFNTTVANSFLIPFLLVLELYQCSLTSLYSVLTYSLWYAVGEAIEHWCSTVGFRLQSLKNGCANRLLCVYLELI